MLKIYDVNKYVSVDNSEWRQVSGKVILDEEKETTLLVFDFPSFDAVREALLIQRISGVHNGKTFSLFGKGKPTIKVSYIDVWESVEYIQFNKMSYKIEYVERNDISLNWIIKNTPADKCIQYLKEHGLSVCPIIK